MDAASSSIALTARRLIRASQTVALGTLAGGAPYVSLALCACDSDGAPLLLLSDLAQHSRNLADDDRVSLLFEDAARPADPPAGARLTALGCAARCEDRRALGRYLARHPEAARYARFGDFRLYRVNLERGHFVAGFGRIEWIDGADLHSPGAEAVAGAEAGIIAHMNQDHADAVQLYAERLLSRSGQGWRITGVDPDGADLRLGEDYARLEFGAPILSVDAARAEFVRLVAAARAVAP